MTIWLTSDTHFGHQAIIEMCARPFTTTADMDDVLVRRWNASVGRSDTVWHLGDFSLGPPGTASRVFRRLNGRKHLVRGNHDGTDVLSCPWASVADLASQKIDGVRLILCHYPMLAWQGSSHNYDGQVHSIHCHGHVHGTPRNSRVPHQDIHRVDVGVDMHAYAPISAEAVVAVVRSSQV